MSMRAVRPPDDAEDAKAMLARASALGASMLVIPPSPPEIPVDPNELSEDKTKLNALNLSWAFGMNRHVGVVNLSTDTRRAVVYACAHTAVLFDMDENSQRLLRGHANNITSICASKDKRWIATADKGPDHVVLIWDSLNGFPVRTMFEPYPGSGVESITMTHDAKYLATLSSAKSQHFSVWDWTVEAESPICMAELSPSFGVQRYIYFNPEDKSQVVTNSDSQVIFYAWDLKGNIEYFAPPLGDEDFNKPVGKYSQSIFLANCSKALTATSFGNLVVWSANKPLTKIVTDEPTPDKKALKLVKIQDRAITVLTTMDHYLVMGDVSGQVRFMDQNLKLVNWYQDIQLGPIFAVSFTYNPHFSYNDTAGFDYPMDAMLSGRSIALRDFVVGTTTGIYAHIITAGSVMKVIHRDHDAAVHALAAHPSEPRVVVGSYSGLLKMWDYNLKEVLVSRYFEKGLLIRCCTFDPNSFSIAVGFTNGQVRLVDAISLDDLQPKPFHFARDAITHIAFSHDCKYLATADAEFTVTVFKRIEGSETFVYLGRNRAHYKTINDILFGIQLDSNKARLMSLGADRYLVEYDLEESSKDDLRVLSSDRIEQSSVALCLEWYPPVTKESFILTANDQYKFKLYNSTTKMCRCTYLAPTYGSPVNKIQIVPSSDSNAGRRYMAYVTNDKVGLQILPLDGNPHKSAGLIAHPHGVSNLAVSYDGKKVFTAGGSDAIVFMWDISTATLEAQAALGGENLLPFYGLMEGGREGHLFRELEDYFYYAQLRLQGIDTMDRRQVDTRIDLSEVPFVMRALGFYPSEQEIDDMRNEVKYSRYVETGQYTTDIDLNEFIRLYINHRPVFGLQADRLDWVFRILGLPTDSEGTSALTRADLLDVLQNRGEKMTEYELAEYLTTLLGYVDEGGSSELAEFDTDVAATAIETDLPRNLTGPTPSHKSYLASTFTSRP
ncbi:hypothetical protein NP493_913g01059 [Ridgeia piscesae]|uniref:Cilia- and flagella-associated protein 251 n=1 Tax=Ridgeia piscesae TaxID=27915 RepID=A0AAD9KKG8_RIDPI|nr:hypothetical protein NP493_913g01059 [Ridgeia piscesae]